MSPHPDFFISYSSQDLDFVATLHQDLENAGFSVWRDKTHIRGTDNWPESIHNALINCKFMILVLSKASMASVQVRREWFFFIDHSKPLLCVWLEDCDVHFQLGLQQRCDFRTPTIYESALENLVQECRYLSEQYNSQQDLAPNLSEGTLIDAQKISAYSDLTWERIATKAANYTDHMLGSRYPEKYSADYYLQRPDILQHFLNFLQSDRKIMVLTGLAGTGKSSFICSLNNALPAKDLILLQDCATIEIDEDTSIDDFVRNIFGFSASTLATFKMLYEADSSYRLILLFDAVNEFGQRELLLKKLSEFVISLNTPAIKVFVTARIPVWNSIKRHLTIPVDQGFHTAGPNSYVSINTFTESELPRVYELYRQQYQLKTSFDELSKQNRNFFSQPLFLKLTAEAYEGQSLPTTLFLEVVFNNYVQRCLGEKNDKTPEFAVLKRAIQLMYEFAIRELEVNLLELDPQLEDFQGYKNLVDRGLFSERANNEPLVKQIETVFVTYERVFEFLLAKIAIHSVNTDKLLEELARARTQSFIQLRGALELFLSFSIIKNKSYDIILEIARLEHPDGRQLLVDVIRALYDAGDRELVNKIIYSLSVDSNQYANLVAVQAAYSLKLDDQLTGLALSEDTVLRDVASIYLYQRWNKARLDGHLEDGYNILNAIVDTIKLQNPSRAKRGVSALLSLSANLLSHLIDDPESLVPLADIFRKLVRKIPGLEPRPDRNALLKFTTNQALSVIAKAFAYTLNNATKDTALADNKSMSGFFADPKNGRALMDSSMFWNTNDLLDQRERLKVLFTWKHDLPAIQIRGPVLYHMYKSPEKHFAFLEELFYDLMNTGHIQGSVHLTAAIIYAIACRVLRNEEVLEEHITQLEDIAIELWHFLDGCEENGALLSQICNTLIGLFMIEAVLRKRRTDLTPESRFLKRIIADIGISIKPVHLENLFLALERFAYMGYPEFAVTTLLDEKIRNTWEIHAPQMAVKAMANLRAFYQEEVDGLLLDQSHPKNRQLWDEVRAYNSMPNMTDIFSPSLNLWLVATSVVPTINKVGGVVLLDLVNSKSVDEFIDRLFKTLLAALFDYTPVDIGFMTWFRMHFPEWDNFERFEIPREYADPSFKPEIQEHAVNRVKPYIEAVGKGVYFDEL